MRTTAMLRQGATQVLTDLRVRPRHFVVLALLVGLGGLARWFEPPLAPDFSNWETVDLWTAAVLCGVMAFVALAGLAIFIATSLWSAELLLLRAMWRPVAVVLLAAALLFFSGQGQELGVSLMIGVGDWLRAIFLLLVLVYWALNNWHSARLGIWRATNPEGEPARLAFDGDTPSIFWGPGLIGVCAHLLAAVSLAIAALKQPDFGDGWVRYVAPFASAFIILALTYCVYRFDRAQVDKGGGGASVSSDRSLWSLVKGLWDFVKFVLRRSWKFLLFVSGVLSLVAAAFYFILPEPLHGFVVGSLAISESAVVYLTFISAIYRRKPARSLIAAPDAEPERETRTLELWTIWLFLFEMPFVFWTWWDAPQVGRTFGSMVIALFTFGALLATVNGMELATAWAGQRIFGRRPRRRVLHAYATVGVLAICFFNAFLQPFHAVRRCQGGDCLKPEDRLRVQRAADLWFDQARAAYTQNGGGADDKVPMLIVATAGGGIRAAYWTATVLDKIETDLAANGGARPYLFAISGVSGGSVGAAAFSAALAARDEAHCDLRSKDCPKTTSYLNDDYFAPALAAWIYKDTLANLFPFLAEDRAGALERSFEYASNQLMARSFLGFFNREPEFDGKASRTTWNPILLLNATHEETGKRIIASQVAVERDVFVDAYDELDVLHSDLRASTAAVNSARFFYVSPAGNLGDKAGSVIDGGYYENYGALTALELARAAGLELGDKVRVVLLMITSDPELGNTVGDPDLDKSATLVRIDRAGAKNPCVVNDTERDPARATGSNFLPVLSQKFENAWLNEFLAPLQGLAKVREAHGNRAAAELALQTCAEYPKPTAPPEAGQQDDKLSSQRQIARTLTVGRGVVPSQTQAAKATPDLPYFAHVGMCEVDRDPDGQHYRKIGLTPPLGWVLSRATRDGIATLVGRCGNKEQLDQLESALAPLPPTNEQGQK